MIKVTNEIRTYAKDNHLNERFEDLHVSQSYCANLIRLQIMDTVFFVDADDLIAAIKNSQNVNRY